MSLKIKDYKSFLANWDQHATVRHTARRVITPEDEGKYFFPPNLEPVAIHPTVTRLGSDAVRFVLIQRLYSYLHFTAKLERYAVNPAALSIADNILGFDMCNTVRLDADKIYTDEAWHAQFSNDLLSQVQEATAIKSYVTAIPPFLRRLREVLTSDENPDLLRLIFAIVSETLISSILQDIPSDPRVAGVVRDEVRDHARDEAIHHRFFSDVLRLVWRQLSPIHQLHSAILVPEFIRLFLAPDLETMRNTLSVLGCSVDESALVIAESYPEHEILQNTRLAARHTLELFSEVGAVNTTEVADAFLCAGLGDA